MFTDTTANGWFCTGAFTSNLSGKPFRLSSSLLNSLCGAVGSCFLSHLPVSGFIMGNGRVSAKSEVERMGRMAKKFRCFIFLSFNF